MQGPTEEPWNAPHASSDLGVDRTRLAYDRTLLAWIRTATSLITFGFAIQQFFWMARAGAPESKGIIGPHEFGFTMIVLGVLALLLATLDHHWRMRALRAQYPAMEWSWSRANVLAALVALLGLFGLISMFFRE